ncbi:MAG: cupin domain-containing protein [Thermoleophilia bacterium]
MLTASTPRLELGEAWIASDPRGRVRPAFPINMFTGAQDTAVVYFEVEPGDYLPTHTDSAEEVLYIVAGEGEAHVGDERGRVSAGDLAVIPSMVPHGIANVGDETLKVVGFFCDSEIVSTFAEPLQPIGATSLTMGAPVAA